MQELTAQSARPYLIAHGRLAADDDAAVALLAGGVSNVVLLVTPEHGSPFVLKQSRAQLRTQADWFSRLDRIFRETEAQRALSKLLPAGSVPEVVFEDRDNYCYAMSAVRADHVVWKRQLLAGEVNGETFRRAGELLGSIHAATDSRWDLLSEPHDTNVFFELRVDPFYRRIAEVHPAIQPAIDGLIHEMNDHAACLVHADFSPKNLLIHPNGLTLVDHETVHFGDPAFDLGFFFSHLWLKAVALPAVRAELIDGIRGAWRAYRQAMKTCEEAPGKRSPPHPNPLPRGGGEGTGIRDADWIGRASVFQDELSSRAVLHLAACLLSRVDGKSPVDYLTQESQRDFVRRLALDWFRTPPDDLDEAFQRLEFG